MPRYNLYFRGGELTPVDFAGSTAALQAQHDRRDPDWHNAQGRITVVRSDATQAAKDSARLASRGVTYLPDFDVRGREAKVDARFKAHGHTHKTYVAWPSKHSPRPIGYVVYSIGEFDDDMLRRFSAGRGGLPASCERCAL